MSTNETEGPAATEYEFVAFTAWFAVCGVLFHIILVFNLYQKQCTHESKLLCGPLIYSFIYFGLHTIVLACTTLTMSTYWIHWSESKFDEICMLGNTIFDVAFGFACVTSLFVFLGALEETFRSGILKYSKPFAKLIKVLLIISIVMAAVVSTQLSSQIITVQNSNHDAPLLVCLIASDESTLSSRRILSGVSGVIFEFTQLTALYMFLSKTYKVCQNM